MITPDQQAWTGDRAVGNSDQQLRIVGHTVLVVGPRPGPVEHEFAVGIQLLITGSDCCQTRCIVNCQMVRFPSRVSGNDSAPLKAFQKGVAEQGVAAMVQLVPCGGADLGKGRVKPELEIGVRADCLILNQVAQLASTSSRNFSASSAAMQPKPADVMA